MKNKKVKQEISTSTITLLILGIIAIVLLVIVFTFGWDKLSLGSFQKNSFTITEKVCHNETNQMVKIIGKNDSKIFVFNDTYELAPQESIFLYVIERDQHYYWNNYQEENFSYEYSDVRFDGVVSAEYFDYETGKMQPTNRLEDQEGRPIFKKEFYNIDSIKNPTDYWIDVTLQFHVYQDIYLFNKKEYVTEVCEQVEVDEIEYVYDKICHSCTENPKKCKEDCLDKANDCLDKYSIYDYASECEDYLSSCRNECQETICNFDCEDISSKINKEDITKEWLDENAECISDNEFPLCYWKMPKEVCGNCICEKENDENFKSCPNDCSIKFKSKCSKYKFGDYLIEVK